MAYISVIIANYNHAQHLKSLYDSIKSSGLDDYEIIVVDDKSTDSSVSILEKLDLKLIKLEENRGPAFARNRGVEVASGEIILFCDSDIEVGKNVLKGVKERFEKGECDTLVGNLAFPPIGYTAAGFFYLYEEWENISTGGLKSGPTRYWSTTLGFIRKDLFEQMSGFDIKYKGADIEDLVFAFSLPQETKSFFDADMLFRHYYPSLWLIVKKLFLRSYQFAQIDEDLSHQPLFENNHRKMGYLLSLPLFLAIINWKLFFPIALLKIFHHRILFRKMFQEKGVSFCLYSLWAMYCSSFAALAGYGLGLLKSKTSSS